MGVEGLDGKGGGDKLPIINSSLCFKQPSEEEDTSNSLEWTKWLDPLCPLFGYSIPNLIIIDYHFKF